MKSLKQIPSLVNNQIKVNVVKGTYFREAEKNFLYFDITTYNLVT